MEEWIMDMAVIFARFWGIFSIAFYGALLLNKRAYEIMLKAKDNEAFIIMSGLINLILGAFQVSVLNQWELSYRGVVTFIGWFTLIKGFYRFLKPEETKSAVAENVVIRKAIFINIYFVISILFGIYLVYMSFIKS
jgi:uncharacterized membrane protein